MGVKGPKTKTKSGDKSGFQWESRKELISHCCPTSRDGGAQIPWKVTAVRQPDPIRTTVPEAPVWPGTRTGVS